MARQCKMIESLKSHLNQKFSALKFAKVIGEEDEIEEIYKGDGHFVADPISRIKQQFSANLFEFIYDMA